MSKEIKSCAKPPKEQTTSAQKGKNKGMKETSATTKITTSAQKARKEEIINKLGSNIKMEVDIMYESL